MKVHLIQISVNEKDTEGNLSKAVEKFKNIESGGIAVLPEMFIPGYDKTNMEFWADKWREVVMEFSGIAKNIFSSVVFTTPVKEKGKIYNRSLFIDEDGKVLSIYDKVHLFRLMDEDKIFDQGNELKTFDYKEWKIGLNTCYDIRFPESQRKLWSKGANLIIVPATWPYERVDAMIKLSYARAIENQCYFVIVNRASHMELNPNYGGNSMIIAPDGALVAGCNHTEEVISGEIDISEVEKYRKLIDCKSDRRIDLY
ncbi:MAG: carbon-nitrogen family hydrolase [Candidatus Delongbacteria bacterium]|nr:carbon-nitrogen family hydrolase [Candidatus Delongbacteria bacterium]MCG2759830.1 carbon-nitrogen family hydrolase [Candidatus Delongbacteria bacterium]